MEPEPRGGDGAFDLMGVLRRRKWVLVLVFLGSFAAAASLVTFLPDIYRSSATVLIERQQIPEELVKSTVTSGLDTRLPTITQEILSRARLEGLIDRFGLYTDLRKKAPLEAVIDQMRQDVDVEFKGGERRSDRITIAFMVGYRGRDPQKVALVANTLASFYIEENLKVRERQATGTADFLRTQLEEVKAKLDEQEKLVSAFKERHMGELPQQLDANLKTLEQLNVQLRLNADNQVRVNEQRAALAAQVAEADGVITPGGVNSASARLAELRKVLADLQTRYSDKYPDVVSVKAEIAALELRLQNAASAPAGPVFGGASLELRRALAELDGQGRALRSEADNLRRSVALYQQRVENAPKREQEFQGLSRDYEASKEQYRSLLRRGGESELAESMEQRQKGEQFRIIEPALVSQSPAAPNRSRLILFALGLALGLAAFATALAEQLDATFHSSHELRRRTGLQVVSIPPIVSPDDARERRRRFGLGALSAVVGLAAIVAGSYFVARENGQLSAKLMRAGLARPADSR
jgi:polysaccharide chain length determinant protein (PEP-CTERM system associated)